MAAQMSKKGWKYDFVYEGERYQDYGFATKSQAQRAERERRRELKRREESTGLTASQVIELIQNMNHQQPAVKDMPFRALVEQRMEYIAVYHSEWHYHHHRFMKKRWLERWGHLKASQVTREEIRTFVAIRLKDGPYAANREIEYLRALFNWGINEGHLGLENPTKGMKYVPVEKRIKYVPPPEDVVKVLNAASQSEREYLYTIWATMGRMSEINRLTWDDVNFDERCLWLYTRKKRGGSLTPRKVPMTQGLFEVLSKRFERLKKGRRLRPWVFWHRYWSRKQGKTLEGPYIDRKKLMRKLCDKAGVKYFRYHALRHSGASVMDQANVPIGDIQGILGHENRTTTEIYLHSIRGSKRKAIEAFEEAIQPVLDQVDTRKK